ncbi:ABC-type dipeptide/oligopeptide/nickel transport system ATPase component [Streptomyces sp. LBL]|uniref:hypothetical protein n=1 Tax=Streptomyces sp. LBL TaxID=2940562 RepID=UPI0024741335|nr:hypothetical protein [Streptomyces sp. LBL]MDH6624431.1 ABC-type dipeptide/oligopeptide/nickel transport system ATPase component [Streptomyces sp. LBL]
MQLVYTPAGDGVVVMEAAEILIVEVALSRHVLENPYSHLAVRMLADVSRVNEEREARMEDLVEGAAEAPMTA